MQFITHDFYAGFEGEPELVIVYRLKGLVQASLHAWIGYFNYLMEAFPAPPEGWSGIAYHHHMNTGWNDGEWIDPSPTNTLEIVSQARQTTNDARVGSFADALMELCENAKSRGGEMVWRLD